MLFLLLANLVVLIHFSFVLFVVFGGLLVLRRPRLAWLHVPSFLWGALIEFGGWICPLTPLENWLRWQGGGKTYEGGFLVHYLLPILYPERLPAWMFPLIGIFVLAINAVFYGLLVRRMLRKPL